MEELTVHCMVRNEPFVYYAVKSVYDYASIILLYDTGSYDRHTLDDIDRLIAEDTEGKIVFKKVPIEVNEIGWNSKTYMVMAKANKGKKGTWWVRQMMIDDTDTKFFMILDGDEVYYKNAMERIHKEMNNWDQSMICAMVPLIWFSDIDKIFHRSVSGRIFVTDRIGMTEYSPGELHTDKLRGVPLRGRERNIYAMKDIQPYAHFEKILKPWRREVKNDKLFTGDLPEVMISDTKILDRFLTERHKDESKD